MIKRFTILLILISMGIHLLSQTITLSGRIVVSTSKEPLPGATVAIYYQQDSVLRYGTVSDSTGLFKITALPKGKYNLEISFIGFVPDTIYGISLTQNKDLGTIRLKPSKILPAD